MLRTWDEVMSSEYSYEVYWIAGVVRTASGWMLNVIVRKARTNIFETIQTPLVNYCDLVIGSLFLGGKRLGVSRGVLGTLKITDASSFSRVKANEIPSALYSFPAVFSQNLLAYQSNDRLFLIAESEMIRKLFGLDSYLSNLIMYPTGIFHLISPQPRTSGDRYHVELSTLIAQPHRRLKRAEHYAWLAFDAAVRRSWDSVRELSSSGNLAFNPPAISLSMTVSSIQRGKINLVTEIVHCEAPNRYSGVLSWS